MIKNLKEWREPVAAFFSFLELSPVGGIKKTLIPTIEKRFESL